MGMYPSAELYFGIDVGEWEWFEDGELSWWTQEASDGVYGDPIEAARAVLKEAGIQSVMLEYYGDGSSDVTYYVLTTRSIRIRAYEARVIRPEQMGADDAEVSALEYAWTLLFGDREHEEPGWIGTVSYD